ncbi:50S ribosomal protein L5 [Candidatus Campbellbacteria bacterium RIFCSPHIGHO2_12_FULL_35_10]|uniref:Large ribosomal subunit protein uL5 n=1 Tax=Candidatus Campbellbacteria bacterium RIFCSPHIGHO2_12_FULL_35_10 TaxID=1797578 RepID=A0A1F5ELW4_9BACT|nr:MAG: 50S ribosomal protein L5 [Candidatus Campbellbacteria bacterium RIFCSPHIGHO2_12_FULL_35_10]
MEMFAEKKNKIFDLMKADFGYKNVMQAPKIEKIIVSVGTGSVNDKNKIALIEDRITKITGQKPSARKAKKSIAAFKLREGTEIGYQVTMRGERMGSFFDKMVNIALPRTKDFRGLSRKSVDSIGNYTLGLRDHTIFTEASDEELKNVFGMSITIVTTAKSKEEAIALLSNMGWPFKKEADDTVGKKVRKKK